MVWNHTFWATDSPFRTVLWIDFSCYLVVCLFNFFFQGEEGARRWEFFFFYFVMCTFIELSIFGFFLRFFLISLLLVCILWLFYGFFVFWFLFCLFVCFLFCLKVNKWIINSSTCTIKVNRKRKSDMHVYFRPRKKIRKTEYVLNSK